MKALPVVDNWEKHHASLEFVLSIGDCAAQLSAGEFSETREWKLFLDRQKSRIEEWGGEVGNRYT